MKLRNLLLLLIALIPLRAFAANELQLNLGETGRTLYAIRWNESGQAWKPSATAFATYTTTRSDFAIALSEIGATGYYKGDFPGTAGATRWEFFLQSAGSPSQADDISLAVGSGYWNGTVLGADIRALGTVSPFIVDDDHTWSFDSRMQTTSPDILTESVGEPVIYKAMDFTEPLTANGSIASITAVSVADVSGATKPTVTTSAISPDKKKVHVTLSATSATAATYTITVSITSTDSRTFTRKGKLTLQ